MDLLSLAQQRFQQLTPRLARPMTLETSEAVEGWVRDQVCPAAEQLMRGTRFQEWALWSPARLGRGSTSPQRRLVERVDLALVRAARQTLEAARGLGLLPTPAGDDTPPDAPTTGLSLLEWLAGRPWFDLAYPREYFTAEGGLHLTNSRRDCGDEFRDRHELRVPLGDYVGRAVLARVGYLAGKIEEAFRTCLIRRPPDGRSTDADHARAGEMFAANVELDRSVVELRRACLTGTEPRLRDACATLVQLYAAYGPDPDAALGWFGSESFQPSVLGAAVRTVVRPPGEIVLAAPDGRGGFRVVGRERARLCRPDVALVIAGSLAAVAELYRRPVEADQLVEWMRHERRLVLVDRRPRLAFWDGQPVGPAWDRNAALWDLLWKLASRARRLQPVHREELAPPGPDTSAVKNRRSRLSKSIPPGMDALIEDVRPGGYRLALGPDEIGLLQLDHDEQLTETSPEVGPALV